MMVLNFTTGTAERDMDDDVIRTDGVVLLNGDEVFCLPDVGWIYNEHDRDMTIANAFILKLREVLS